MNKFFRSLLAKYMLIILMALFLIQFIYLLIAALFTGMALNADEDPRGPLNTQVIEENWHQEASGIEDVSEERVHEHFLRWQAQYPEASFFWVDWKGELRTQVNVKDDLPSAWTSAYTARFIKERYGGDPYTVIAFLGQQEQDGFIVYEISRAAITLPHVAVYQEFGSFLMVGVLLIIILFIFVSFLFFRGIRKRLLQLEEALTIRDVDGLPLQIEIKKKDEIGQLEQAFNQMVTELRDSRKREQEEERLRKELIATLSHDLRTPLTKMRAQAYSMAKEDLSEEGQRALKALEASITSIDRLIENLMSYTLLTVNKYQYASELIDMIRFVRESLASWYPVFEKEQFHIEVDLAPFETNRWQVDPTWLGRILDNIFQNVLRHAKCGRYLGVQTVSTEHFDELIITDRGRGFKNESNEKGAGIGLSIVDLMVKGMKLEWDIESTEHGTSVRVKRKK